MITILKTYMDYQLFIDKDLSSKVLSNISFAVFLDFSVLIIGGLFLYLSNQFYVASVEEERKIKKLESYREEQEKRNKVNKKQLKKQKKRLLKDNRQPTDSAIPDNE